MEDAAEGSGDGSSAAAIAATSDFNQGSRSLLLAAGRLEAQMAIEQRHHISAGSTDKVVCSVDNLLAIVDTSSAIRLVHLSSPQRVQTLAIQEKPYLLSFSPRGDALFAAFGGSGSCCLWTRSSQALNDWRLKQTWLDWQGKILDLQWLGAPRKYTSPKLSRRAARGPQFVAERAMKEMGALVICESGQMVMFQGSIAEDANLQVQMINVSIPLQEKIAKAAIGLVADESSALLAFSKRMSSKAVHPRSTVEGDALGMFFEGAEEVVGLDQQKNDSSQLDDGQDKIEMMEVRLDLASSSSSLALRPILPIYLSSYEVHDLPSAMSLTQLMWLDVDEKVEEEAPIAKMKLFGSFYSEGTSTLRIWEAQREEVEVLSEAFSKLEAAKAKSIEEEREEWVVRSCLHQSFPNYIADQYQQTPSGTKLLCCWTSNTQAFSLTDVVKLRTEYRLIDCSSLQLSEVNALPTLQSRTCMPALSSNGHLAAQVVNGKVCIVQASKEVRWSHDDSIAYWPAIQDGADVSDVIRSCPCDLESVASALHLDGNSFRQTNKMLQLAARTPQSDQSNAKTSLIMLELLQCYTIVVEADRQSYFDQSQIWIVLSCVEWIVWLVEVLAKQAFLEHATVSISTPAQTPIEATTSIGQSVDLLALMTLPLPRKALAQCIIRMVKFCNWLYKVNRSEEEVKTMMNSDSFRESLKGDNQVKDASLWSLTDNLRLAQMQVGETLLQSAVDLSQIGRILQSYKNPESEETKRKVWAFGEVSNRGKVAEAIMEGQCIRAALSLFCPDEGEEERDSTERDILTKAKLNLKAQHFICLSCQGKTQTTLVLGQDCVCGSRSWWRKL